MGCLTMARLGASWPAWRGRAVEPVVRESLRRLSERLPAGTGAVGGYGTRNSDVEIDLVGADREPIARAVTFVGSIKWQESRPFDVRDLGRLAQHRDRMPGAGTDTPLLVVSRTGSTVDGLAELTPDDLLDAYRVR